MSLKRLQQCIPAQINTNTSQYGLAYATAKIADTLIFCLAYACESLKIEESSVKTQSN